MSQVDEIINQLPLAQLAGQFGVDESQVKQAAQSAVPALLGGLQANADDPAGADSIISALGQHTGDVPTDADQVDAGDGEKIVGHIFGQNTDQVVNQLGATTGGDNGLVKKLLPIIAPIVMAYLAKRLTEGGLGGLFTGGNQQQSAPQSAPAQDSPTPQTAPDPAPAQQAPTQGGLQDILGGILGGQSQGQSGGGLLGGILGGLLGGGRR